MLNQRCPVSAFAVRRINTDALHALRHTPAAFAQFWKAPGACRAQKSRRISSKCSRFSPKIASFCRRLSCKKQRRAQEKLRVLRNVQKTIIHIILMQRACVGGRNRADFQNFFTQNRANFNRKTARFRRRKCAQRATKARRVSAHALHAVWHTLAPSVKLL